MNTRYLTSLSDMECYHLIQKIRVHILRDEAWDWPTLYAVYPQSAATLKYLMQRAPRFV